MGIELPLNTRHDEMDSNKLEQHLPGMDRQQLLHFIHQRHHPLRDGARSAAQLTHLRNLPRKQLERLALLVCQE